MKKIVTRWRLNSHKYFNIVEVQGIVLGNEHNEITSRMLITNAFDVISTAQKYRGKLSEVTSMPHIKEQESVIFNVVFKNNRDKKSFIKAIQNRS